MSYPGVWEVEGGISGRQGPRWEVHALGFGAPDPGHVGREANTTSAPFKRSAVPSSLWVFTERYSIVSGVASPEPLPGWGKGLTQL